MRTLFLLLTFFGVTPVFSQNLIWNNTPEGYYEGAVIRGNSVALLTADFFREDDTLFVESNVKEWTYYEPLRAVVTEEDGVLRFNTYYGEATVVFDSAYTEMAGTLRGTSPAYELHLKKVLRPAAPALEERTMTFDVGDLRLQADLIIPKGFQQPLPCAIFVRGRGCGNRQEGLQRARVLARYGMATLIYDKRGSEGTGFDCDQGTLALHASDLRQIIEQVVTLKEIDTRKVGLIGTSYGGWVAPRAAAMAGTEVAFIVTLVGPATSVQQQQLDNAVYFVQESLGSDEEIVRQIQEYTLLEYEAGNEKETYRKMQALLALADQNGWRDILSDGDTPTSPEDLPNLWVRRNIYDPADDLKRFSGPFLSILGEADWVVPWRENSERLTELFSGVGKTNYRITILPSTPHWLEHGDILRNLGYQPVLRSQVYYFKFDRVVPGVMDEMVVFLREYGFLP